jgi:hypothetical protein
LKSGLKRREIFLKGFMKGFIKWRITKTKRGVSISGASPKNSPLPKIKNLAQQFSPRSGLLRAEPLAGVGPAGFMSSILSFIYWTPSDGSKERGAAP